MLGNTIAKKGEGFIPSERWADGADELGLRVRRRVGDPTSLSWVRKEESITAKTTLDGLYVIRTSLGSEQLEANAAAAAYKSLSQVERAFRSIKTVDLHGRSVFHFVGALT